MLILPKTTPKCGGLGIHIKRMRKSNRNPNTFKRTKCKSSFRTESAMKNHQKSCEDGETDRMTKRCLNCNTDIKFQLPKTFQNMPHNEKYTAKHPLKSTARIYRSKYTTFLNCQIQVSATNLANNRRTCSQGGDESVPFEERTKDRERNSQRTWRTLKRLFLRC